MPQPYVAKHWDVFQSIPYQSTGATGFIPANWVVAHELDGVPAELPATVLSRDQVREICQDQKRDVLFGYLCAMAWGGQGAGPGGSSHVVGAWVEKEKIKSHLNQIRDGSLTRAQAYDLFLKDKIYGLGPAYWTKLLYFFSPTDDFYIMDQWTGKSVNLLTGFQVVRMDGDAVSPLNACGNYQAYCEEIDSMASLLKQKGADVEEMLMSQGGRKPQPWRAYVNSQCRYDPEPLRVRYPHIKDRF